MLLFGSAQTALISERRCLYYKMSLPIACPVRLTGCDSAAPAAISCVLPFGSLRKSSRQAITRCSWPPHRSAPFRSLTPGPPPFSSIDSMPGRPRIRGATTGSPKPAPSVAGAHCAGRTSANWNRNVGSCMAPATVRLFFLMQSIGSGSV
jgi:hypothetical protein